MSILSNYYFLLNSDDDVTSVFSEDIGSSDEKDELRTEINEDGTNECFFVKEKSKQEEKNCVFRGLR